MIWLGLIAAALAGYYIGAMRAFAFNGYTVEPWTRPFDTMQPGFGAWWRGERPWRDYAARYKAILIKQGRWPY